MKSIQQFFSNRFVQVGTLALSMMSVMCSSCFAAEGIIAPFTIDATLITPLTDAINSGLKTLVPIGIGIMATFIGISLIKRVIYTFL